MIFTGWPDVLGRVVEGAVLDNEEAALIMGEVLEGRATSAQLAALLAVLRARGETIDEMSGFAAAMRAVSIELPLSGATRRSAIDTCGTGGDRSNTINVSTVVTFIAAAAGVPVCKHGNRAASSLSGAADVLEALGAVIDPGPESVARCVEDVGLGFCFAPTFHPAMRFPGPTRRELGIATAFNFLGPMVNPGRVERQLIGVSDPNLARTMIDVLSANGSSRAMVVHGRDGLDEITTTTTTTVHELIDGRITTYDLDPRTFGLAPASSADLVGGDAAHNASRTRAILGGEPGPQRDIAVLNAAAALVVGSAVTTIADGVELASAVIDDGSASAKLEQFVTSTKA